MVRPQRRVRPERAAFRELARTRATIPLVREELADLDTPLATFLKVDDGKTAFLFESVEGGERWGRYSIIGVGARAQLIAQGGVLERRVGTRREQLALPADRSCDPLDVLRGLLRELRPAELPGLPKFAGGAVGFLSYDWVRFVERLPERCPDHLRVPDAYFTVPELVLVHDRMRQVLHLIVYAEVSDPARADAAYDAALEQLDAVVAKLEAPVQGALRGSPPPAPAAEPGAASLEAFSNSSRARYHEVVKRAVEYIRAGDIFQVVPSQRFTLPLRVDPVQIYRWLRVINPSPYLFFLRAGERVVLGSSPEILVRLEGGEVVVRPIAGTRPRGATPEQDRENERALLADPKELAEHIMLVDLGRNDVGRVAELGSVRVDELHTIERYSHVMHIVSSVSGRLREGCDAIDVLRACFPAGTLTGAPKVRAMEIIEELEPERRGLYGGAVGYLDFHGDMDMCIAIRTLLVQDGQIHVQAGGGVVADSDPDREYQETLHKAGALIQAIQLADGGLA
jgi:anthranilate synthase component 1